MHLANPLSPATTELHMLTFVPPVHFLQGLGQLMDACMVPMGNSVASAALSPVAAASRCDWVLAHGVAGMGWAQFLLKVVG